MEILLKAHSGVRWLVLLALAISLIFALVTWLRSSPEGAGLRKFMSITVGLLDLQALMGLILLLWAWSTGGGLPPTRLEHAFIMVIALILGHLAAKWKNRPTAVMARNYFLILLAIVILVLAGITRLPTGWPAGMM